MSLLLLDVAALTIFVSGWVGYSSFARKRAKSTNCIARSIQQHRIHWMYEMISHDVRVSEAALLANLERNIAFFASSTLLILAGLLTLFSQVDSIEVIIESIPNAVKTRDGGLYFKLSVMVVIFVIAFFNFTWSMRQYGFVNIMVGACPIDLTGQNKNLKEYARQIAIVGDQAAHSYNYGLRAYYFSLAAICWFYHPVLLMVATVYVVYTLYAREFNSRAVQAITEANLFLSTEHVKKYHQQLAAQQTAKEPINTPSVEQTKSQSNHGE